MAPPKQSFGPARLQASGPFFGRRRLCARDNVSLIHRADVAPPISCATSGLQMVLALAARPPLVRRGGSKRAPTAGYDYQLVNLSNYYLVRSFLIMVSVYSL
jgi:hypothetical protein